jgi:hypothetical protein
MDHKRHCRSAEEKTGEWRHHLPNRTKSPIGGEQGGGVTEAARRLRRIGDERSDRADRTLCRMS